MTEHTAANLLSRQIGDRLRAARSGRSLSLAGLARLTGGRLTKSRISNYEQGIRRMPIESARILAAALGKVSAAHLLCVEDDLEPDDEGRALMLRYQVLSHRGRTRLLQLAQLIAAEDSASEQGGAQTSPEQIEAEYRELRHLIEARGIQRRIAACWPSIRLRVDTWESIGRPAEFECSDHGMRFVRKPSDILAAADHPCPQCRIEQAGDGEGPTISSIRMAGA
jgi:transcriptional regulator with XRE-family HTH domain